MSQPKEPKKNIYFRLPEWQHTELKSLAKRENRSLNNLLLAITHEYLHDPDALRRRATELERDAGS